MNSCTVKSNNYVVHHAMILRNILVIIDDAENVALLMTIVTIHIIIFIVPVGGWGTE